jgi:hypothetical protein
MTTVAPVMIIRVEAHLFDISKYQPHCTNTSLTISNYCFLYSSEIVMKKTKVMKVKKKRLKM